MRVPFSLGEKVRYEHTYLAHSFRRKHLLSRLLYRTSLRWELTITGS
jgi:hypothetical protein